jgi:hypothetical protein
MRTMEEKNGKVTIVVTEDVPLIIKSSSSRTKYDVVELDTGGCIEIHLPCTFKIGQLIGDESDPGAVNTNPWGRDIIITGDRGKNGARGRDGEAGGAATAGERGGDGGDAPDVTIEIGELKRNLNVLNVGGRGGDGGKGGDGGNGGNSGNGGNGGKVVIKCQKMNDYQITSECRKAPCGNAGAGGRGGAGGSGKPPGAGGKSGGNGVLGLSGEKGTIDINP